MSCLSLQIVLWVILMELNIWGGKGYSIVQNSTLILDGLIFGNGIARNTIYNYHQTAMVNFAKLKCYF